ncbi:hypothetical protein GF348_24535 [candidate division KSB3 bacterium]|nr:hypothetical protein [candidate division KSB3 bacterium]
MTRRKRTLAQQSLISELVNYPTVPHDPRQPFAPQDAEFKALLEHYDHILADLPDYSSQTYRQLLIDHIQEWWAYLKDGVWPQTPSGRNAVSLLRYLFAEDANQ